MTNPCDRKKCEWLCLLSPSGPVCTCPNGKRLDNGTCVVIPSPTASAVGKWSHGPGGGWGLPQGGTARPHSPPTLAPSAHHRHLRPGVPERGQLLPQRPQAGQVPVPAALQRREVPDQPVLGLLPERGMCAASPSGEGCCGGWAGPGWTGQRSGALTALLLRHANLSLPHWLHGAPVQPASVH